ncbi:MULTISPECIES: Uma2 family endonuclease [unclassified Limnospira]|uniref:Uma2 family endonuclease n=1 Tax=unclassified Limnospira TaxID=2642885 RepID=UPI0028E0AE6A|nr:MULTISPECIES: Uma2 family endonuclease [unclassified Limnospira]MDT9192365.1 Uma2 family endonuclease [Limnospira sp. PMC 1245.20]MDT9202423.1 Uma2 family endonuclease [Limnospira sp. PMC 1243.20]MDT9207471.1 Uma2 family endonuclease [Limnospira sp. PMC 1252.20]MDT9253575.1 Uma2 family endonuclease [Limnospira sp. PMC 1254.20]MDT9258414.1 Uma2 family endonuclease [Limnospira sp. PMC 1236.20]
MNPTKTPQTMENHPVVLHLHPAIELTPEQFLEICQLNRDLRLERTATGELVIMPPTGSETGGRNFRLLGQLYNWTEGDETGIGFDSGTGFTLPNGAQISPDAAWVKLERWNALTAEEQEQFAPLAPDFVVELRSLSDPLKLLQDKMQQYIDNGVQLGWLIDCKQRRVYIYRPGNAVECLNSPATVSGEPILPGFVLDLSKIW